MQRKFICKTLIYMRTNKITHLFCMHGVSNVEQSSKNSDQQPHPSYYVPRSFFLQNFSSPRPRITITNYVLSLFTTPKTLLPIPLVSLLTKFLSTQQSMRARFNLYDKSNWSMSNAHKAAPHNGSCDCTAITSPDQELGQLSSRS